MFVEIFYEKEETNIKLKVKETKEPVSVIQINGTRKALVAKLRKTTLDDSVDSNDVEICIENCCIWNSFETDGQNLENHWNLIVGLSVTNVRNRCI